MEYGHVAIDLAVSKLENLPEAEDAADQIKGELDEIGEDLIAATRFDLSGAKAEIQDIASRMTGIMERVDQTAENADDVEVQNVIREVHAILETARELLKHSLASNCDSIQKTRINGLNSAADMDEAVGLDSFKSRRVLSAAPRQDSRP